MFRACIMIAALYLGAVPALGTEAGWALLRTGGQVVLMRHAGAPGTGDPANFDIDNCASQRNLSERGRLQARQIGALIAARAAPTGKVLSSRYCRAIETAELVFGEAMVEPFEPLDSLRAQPETEAERTAATMEEIRAYSGSGNFYLVTHLSNIEALAGVSPREGEAVIVSAGEDELTPIGRIVFN